VALGIRVPVLLDPTLTCVMLGGAMGLAPVIPLLVKRSKRLREFEKQLPDALDFLARGMRAGHAFSVSLKVMADESPDPLGQEFRRLCAEYNLGASMPTVLEALLARVPLIDLQFFAAAVTLQRQTGGNISEMMLRLSQVMRERFALKGKVQAASAHGRLTGTVLSAMPICIALFLMITSPQYLGLLLKDPMGKYLILGVLAGQIAGYLCIRKIVQFEV
jgi:tight adherence protein B